MKPLTRNRRPHHPKKLPPAVPAAQETMLLQLDDAVKEVFALMLDRSCMPQTRSCDWRPRFTAVVRFSGSLRGACTIHLDHLSAIQLAEELTGMPLDDAAPYPALAADLAGELCNMIAGSWKSQLAADQSTCALSSPVIESSLGPKVLESLGLDFLQTFQRFYRFGDHCLSLSLSMD